MSVPPARPGEQALWDEVFENDWFFADRFKWTPDQVDNLPIETYLRLKNVTLLVEEVRREKQKRAANGH